MEKTGKWLKVKDLFEGLFDVIAIKPNETRLIQCKTNMKPTLKPFEDFQAKYPQFSVEVWVKYDRKGFVITTFG